MSETNLTSGKMIIVVGPSGAGKSTLVDKALLELPLLEDTITYTTRAKRESESEGHPYHFVDEQKFRQLIKEEFFVEWAEVHNKLYGTPINQIKEAWSNGKTLIMDVDVQGAKTFKKKFPQATSIFILPPSKDALRQRVKTRDGDGISSEELETRMKNAQIELDQADEFDFQLVNDVFEDTYAQFKKKIEEILRVS